MPKRRPLKLAVNNGRRALVITSQNDIPESQDQALIDLCEKR